MTSENNLPDGVYFNIPEAQYHDLKRMSASNIKNVLISIPTFWAKSWMNPEREEVETDTKAKILGSAYHVAIFEPDTLDARYAGEPDIDAADGILTTDTQVKAELKELGLPITKAGENALERAWRLVDAGYDDQKIAAIIKGEFQESLAGRQAIASKYWNQIQRDIERIKSNPEIYELVTGGASEVTILWTDPDSGIPMKARIDKLKKNLFVDLKSFANANGKPVNQAILDQVQYYKYYLSMRVYQIAIRMIKEQDLQAMDAQTAGPDDNCGDLMTAKDHKNLELVEALRAKTTMHEPWLFFQEKNGIPNLLARRLKLQRTPSGVDDQAIGAEDHDIKKADSALAMKADLEIKRALQLVAQAMQVYGPETEWYPFDMIGEIGDEDFRDWFLDSVPA